MRLPAVLLWILTAAAAAQEPQQILARMSLEEKAGRLLMVWSYAKEEGQSAARKRLLALARRGVIGGVVLSKGRRDEALRLIQELQKQARFPLLMAGDFETGLSFRLEGTTHLGTAMLIGATGLSRLARDAGQITAVEGRTIGFHMNFGPVLDVNNNPDNPVINVRSFGGDPTAVARLGAAYIGGLQGQGMLATAKHFPGHGDVSVDSHLALPTVTGNQQKLLCTELVPFRAAVRAGVAAIMTAHLAVPGLGEDPSVPATLSRKILTGVLRRDLGFDGVIVTDALDMGGITKVVDDVDAAPLRALMAGADLLLMPKDPEQARERIVAAVRSGQLSEARLDESVLRLLRLPRRPVPRVKLDPLATATEIARRGLTLVKDDKGLLPLRPQDGIVFLDLAGCSLGDKLEAQGLKLHAGRDLAAARTLIVAVGKATPEADTLAAMRKHPRVIVVSLGNPYLVRGFPEVSTYVCAFDHGDAIEQAAALALSGKQPFTGRLPIRIPEVAPRGFGLSLGFGPKDRVPPQVEGMARDLEPRIRKYLKQAVVDKVFPGAVALVTRRGHVVAEVAAGHESWDPDSKPVAADTIYDLASLTKVCATLPALLSLVAAHKLGLDDRVQDHLPGFTGTNKEKVTIRQLMAHCSGLPAHARYYLRLRGKADILAAVLAEPLAYEPGTRTTYSDLGAILLMAIIEKASGESFEAYVKQVHQSLGMSTACFARVGKPIAAAPTEDCPWRGRVIRGEVHDENAWAMGGISGHAGLFANAHDVARLGNLFLAGTPLERQATRRAGLVPDSSRALLWDTFVSGHSGGSLLSDRAFGHTGFTGASIWCDPRYDLCMVLLTNRVHRSREPRARTITQIRGGFHDLVVRCLEDREERN